MASFEINEKAYLTISERKEIEALRTNADVKLAQLEQRLSYRAKAKLYNLRWLQKRGKQLRADGMDEEALRAAYAEIDDENENE